MREPFILSSPPDTDGFLSLPDEEINHLTKALRFVVGDRFVAFDGKGIGWRAEIVSISKKNFTAKVIEEIVPELSSIRITVAVGAVKGPRMEWAVEKAAELGASNFIPLRTRYAVVEPGEGRARRWKNIAVAAAKQSHRLTLMEFSFSKAIADIPFQNYQRIWVFDLTDDAISLKKVSTLEKSNRIEQNEGILLIIGPEGGFSEEEREFFRTIGAKFISLGSHPLRTETSVAAGLVIAKAHFGQK